MKYILHSSLASPHSCSPSICSASIYTLFCISIISLQTSGPPADPTAYLHYVRCHNVYILFIYCISTKLQSIRLLCQHVYPMQHINYISANLWAISWSESTHTLCQNSGSAFCINLWHLYKLWSSGCSASMHTLCSISMIFL